MKEKMCQVGEYNPRYNPNQCKKKGTSDILNYISEHFTLVQLMDTLGNVNNDISIIGY